MAALLLLASAWLAGIPSGSSGVELTGTIIGKPGAPSFAGDTVELIRVEGPSPWLLEPAEVRASCVLDRGAAFRFHLDARTLLADETFLLRVRVTDDLWCWFGPLRPWRMEDLGRTWRPQSDRRFVVRVRSRDGEAIPGACVQVWTGIKSDKGGMHPTVWQVHERDIVTDARGEATAWGSWESTILVSASGHRSRWCGADEASAQVVLEKVRPLTVTVESAETGEPIRPATLRFVAGETVVPVPQSGFGDGRFECEPFPWSSQRLEASAPGFRTRQVLAGGLRRAGYVVALTPAREIEGRVVDDLTGAPIVCFAAAIQSTAGRRFVAGQHRTAFRDPGGRFRLPLPVDGPVSLFVYGPDRAPSCIAIDPARLDGPIEIGLRRGASVRGRVLDPDGAPVLGAWVWVEPFPAELRRQTATLVDPDESLPYPHGRTDESGRFEIRGVPDGEQVLVVRAKGQRWRNGEPFRAGGSGVIEAGEVRLPRGGAIRVYGLGVGPFLVKRADTEERDAAEIDAPADPILLTGLAEGRYEISYGSGCVRYLVGRCEVRTGEVAEVRRR